MFTNHEFTNTLTFKTKHIIEIYHFINYIILFFITIIFLVVGNMLIFLNREKNIL